RGGGAGGDRRRRADAAVRRRGRRRVPPPARQPGGRRPGAGGGGQDGGLQQRRDRPAPRLRPALDRTETATDPRHLAGGGASLSATPRPAQDLDLAQKRQVNQTCNRFEAAWRAGSRPRLEDYLDVPEGPARCILLRELIPLDAYYRRQAGEAPSAA